MSKVSYLKLIVLLCVISLGSYLIQRYGVSGIRESIDSYGIIAPGAIFLLRFTSIVIPALPSTAYSLLAGGLLGFKNGLITICSADILSCSLSFYLSRRYGKKLIKKLVSNNFIMKVEEISHKNLENNYLLMTGLLMTGLFDFVSYGIGLSKVKWSRFWPSLSISIMLSNPPIVALGAGILDSGKLILILAVFGTIILGIITRYTVKA